MKFLQTLFIAALCFLSTLAHAVPEVSVVVSKTSGTAPLAVHFDGTGTTDSTDTADTFTEYGCYWNYGDSGSGNWATNGKSKNTDGAAPLGAHVYETPGTYDWFVWCYDGLGGEDSANGTITVSDPDTDFSGTNTICYSTNTNHTDCPAGATQVDSVGAWPTWASNTRYLFHVGQDFRSVGSINVGQISNSHFASYGTGTKPQVEEINLQVGTDSYPTTVGAWINNIVVRGLEVTDNLKLSITGWDILIYQNELVIGNETEAEFHFGASWQFYNDLGTYNNNLIHPKNIFVIENEQHANLGKAFGRGQLIWMGNHHSDAWEHNVRLWHMYKGIFAHNDLNGQLNSTRPGRSNLKLQGTGREVITNIDTIISAPHTVESKWMHVHDNLFNDPADPGIFSGASLQAENSSSEQCVRNAVVENNTYYEGTFGAVGPGIFGGANLVQRSYTLVPAAYGTFGTDDNASCVVNGPYSVSGTGDGGVPANGGNGAPGASAARVGFGAGAKIRFATPIEF